MSKRDIEFCYVDHSKPVSHPYYQDHMNAHLRTDECERKEKLSIKRAKARRDALAGAGEVKAKQSRLALLSDEQLGRSCTCYDHGCDACVESDRRAEVERVNREQAEWEKGYNQGVQEVLSELPATQRLKLCVKFRGWREAWAKRSKP